MKKLIAIPVVLLSLMIGHGQTPTAPVVTVATSITATAGGMTCVSTPGIANSISTMHVVCTSNSVNLITADVAVPSSPGTGITYSATQSPYSITWLLTKGNPTPDGWQVSATNGSATVSKTGSF